MTRDEAIRAAINERFGGDRADREFQRFILRLWDGDGWIPPRVLTDIQKNFTKIMARAA